MKAKTRVKTRMIAADSVLRGKLMKIFNVGDRAVRNALDWTSESELAKKIRFTALKNGGVMIAPVKDNAIINDFIAATFHDSDDDRMMRQYMTNGAVIELSKETGIGNVYWHGESVRRYEDVHVKDISSIQKYAAALG